jgi:hypothetical protein
MTAAVEEARSLIERAAEARRAADVLQSAARVKLSAAAWRTGLSQLGGVRADDVARLRAELAATPVLFEHTAVYMHECARMIVTGTWWAPGGGGAPRTTGVSRERVEVELARIGCSVFDALVAMILDLEHAPEAAQTFGPLSDLAAQQRSHDAIRGRATEAAGRVAAIDRVVLNGLVVEMEGRSLEPEAAAARLLDHALAGSPPPSKPRERVVHGASVLRSS